MNKTQSMLKEAQAKQNTGMDPSQFMNVLQDKMKELVSAAQWI